MGRVHGDGADVSAFMQQVVMLRHCTDLLLLYCCTVGVVCNRPELP